MNLRSLILAGLLRGTLTTNAARRLVQTSNPPPGIDWGPPDQSLATRGTRCPYGAGCTCCNAQRYDDFCAGATWGCTGIAYCGCEQGYRCAGAAFGNGQQGTGNSGCGNANGCEYCVSDTNDWGTGNGWCSSDLDEYVGDASDAAACWTMCENTYGSGLVAIDWTPDGECYCQDDCQCMEDMEDGDIHLITSSDVAVLPGVCVSAACPAEQTAWVDCLSNQNSLDDDCDSGGDYFLANARQSCDDACASSGGCDLAAITAAAASTSACGSVLDDLGVSYANGPSGYYDDNSGCTTHPGQGGWAQVYWNPTCDEVNSDPSRQRVCACNCGTSGGDDDDDDNDDDDDDFSPNTCADVQQWLSDGLCQDGPAVCQTEYQAYVECTYEDLAQSFLGLTCDFACARDCPAGSFDNLDTCEDCDALDGDCADCECSDFKLLYDEASCVGSDRGANLGAFSSTEECAAAAADAGCTMFMFSDYSYDPSWGCRCCFAKTGWHQNWRIYSVDSVVEANCKAACLPAPVVTGSISLSGITVEDAEANKAVLQDAIARVAGVDTEAVTIQSVASARRRLQASVIVDYKIEANDFVAAEEASEKLQDTSIIEAEIESSAAAIGKEKVFMNVNIEELSVAVVTTEAPTAAPTTYWDNKKKRKDDVMLLIIIIVCSVAGVCCLLALGTAAAFGAFGSCGCFAKKKKTPTRVAEPSAPSAPVPLAMAQYVTELPPMSPGTLAKTQEHIRRTAALMAEAPPSPGPPPLAPIKATETLAPEMP